MKGNGCTVFCRVSSVKGELCLPLTVSPSYSVLIFSPFSPLTLHWPYSFLKPPPWLIQRLMLQGKCFNEQSLTGVLLRLNSNTSSDPPRTVKKNCSIVQLHSLFYSPRNILPYQISFNTAQMLYAVLVRKDREGGLLISNSLNSGSNNYSLLKLLNFW